MKAKELKDKARKTARYGKHTLVKYVFTEEEMAIFWSQLCAEQREICSKSVSEITGTNYNEQLQWQKQIVKHAPEPEIE